MPVIILKNLYKAQSADVNEEKYKRALKHHGGN